MFILTGGLLGRYFAWVILGRGVWKGGRVIRAILGLAKSHGSALPPWRLPGSTNSMMEYQMHKDKDKDKDNIKSEGLWTIWWATEAICNIRPLVVVT